MPEFPKDFLWGAATAAYQVEGGNIHSDWYEWEKRVNKESSGNACRHYELFESDFDLAKQLNHNAHRLSAEWSRIEPQEGKFDEEALGHYRRVIDALLLRSIKPVVTIHHFTLPLWLARQGGWKNPKTIDYYLRFCERLVKALSGQVTYWVTINEPMVYVYHAYIIGAWPPQERSLKAAKIVTDNLARAHIAAYTLIHALCPSAKVSIAKNIRAFVPCGLGIRNYLAASIRDKQFNTDFLDRLMRKRTLDYIGLNYYSRELVDLEGWMPQNFLFDVCRKGHETLPVNSLGWPIYPQGLYDLLMSFRRYNLPVIITENGICTSDDQQRWEYIRTHLEAVHQAMSDGVKVEGYLYWSLLDNFEWDKGFAPRFGLIEVDYATYQRSIRMSARRMAEVIAGGKL